jgi:hypothetical protein
LFDGERAGWRSPLSVGALRGAYCLIEGRNVAVGGTPRGFAGALVLELPQIEPGFRD